MGNGATWWVALVALLWLGSACRPASEVPAPPPAAGQAELSNTLKWSTRREVGNVGFDVYRAEHPDGPFERLTPAPIPGAGTSEEAHDYTYLDHTLRPGVEYFYYVESLDQAGVRARVTPVIRAPAKGKPPLGTAAGG